MTRLNYILIILAAFTASSFAKPNSYDFLDASDLRNDNLVSHLDISSMFKNIPPKDTLSKDNDDNSFNMCEDNDDRIDIHYGHCSTLIPVEIKVDNYLNLPPPDQIENSLLLTDCIILI